MKVPFLNINLQNAPLKAEFQEAISEIIDCGAFAGGPYVAKFEADYAAFTQSQHAIGVSNGTDALWLALLALGIGPGDEVITVPSTFMATAEAISYCGARPVFVDIDPVTYTMDPQHLQSVLTPRTRAVIPVHLFGQPADMQPIAEFAREHGLAIIEDAAQAHGSTYRAEPIGTRSDAACYSFYPGKNLGALGEAGAVTTNNPEVAEKIRTLRDHGQAKKYFHSMIGWNSRMDGIQAAALQIKLRHLSRGNERRRMWAARYNEGLSQVEEIVRPVEADYAKHVYHLYAIRVAERDELIKALAAQGIGTGIHYPIPVHLQEAYQPLGYGPGSFPIAEKYAQEFLSLPMFPELLEEQVECVIDALEQIFTKV